MRLLGIQATRFLDIALDDATLLAVLVERLAHDLGGDGNGKVCNRGGSSCVDGVALVLGIGMGLGDDILGLLVRCLDDASALGLGILAGLKNDVCRLTAGARSFAVFLCPSPALQEPGSAAPLFFLRSKGVAPS